MGMILPTRMLGKYPRAVQKGIRELHAQESVCAQINLQSTLKKTQVRHRHYDGCEVMHDNRGFEKMLAPRSANEVDAHGQRQNGNRPVETGMAHPFREGKDDNRNSRRNDTAFEFNVLLVCVCHSDK